MLGSSAAFLVGAGFFVVWLLLDAYGFHPLRAREGHVPSQMTPAPRR